MNIGAVKSPIIWYFNSFESLLAFQLYNYSHLSDELNLLKSCHHGCCNGEKKLFLRDWTFSSFIFLLISCNLTLKDDLNGVQNLWYGLNQIEVFLIFHFKMENQKVIFLTTWVVEWNFGLNFHKIWLKISGGTKNSDRLNHWLSRNHLV